MQKRVIIVGGGFAGLAAARRLSSRQDLHVQLLEPRRQFEFTPLIPYLFGGGLTSDDLVRPMARAARRWGFEHRREAAVRINLKNSSVTAERGKYTADAILLACGGRWGSAPANGADAGCFSLSSVAAAVAACERLLHEPRDHWVVVGGGLTGVELAANLAVMAKANKLPNKVVLVEAGERLCPELNTSLSALIDAHLQKLGIEILLSSVFESFDHETVDFHGGGCIHDAFVLMANGMAVSELSGMDSIPQTANHRLSVKGDLRIAGCDNLFAAGDVGFLNFEKNPSPCCSAANAMKQGDFAAGNILRLADGRRLATVPPKSIRPLVPLANGYGVGTLFGWPIAGRLPGILSNRFFARHMRLFDPPSKKTDEKSFRRANHAHHSYRGEHRGLGIVN